MRLFYFYFIIYFIKSDYDTKRPGFGFGFCQALGLAIKKLTQHNLVAGIGVHQVRQSRIIKNQHSYHYEVLIHFDTFKIFPGLFTEKSIPLGL